MHDNYFVHPDESYTRNIDPIENYLIQVAKYIQIKTKKSTEECRAIAKGIIQNNVTGNVRNPVVKYLERSENGDKYSKQVKLYEYITGIIKENEILAPTFTTYLHPSIKVSILSSFIEGNVKQRSISKKLALTAKARGDTELYIAKNNEQGIMKIYNNSLSGAFGSTGTSLINLTGHSTLTSTTRSVSSMGNAINEKLIAGNRHYRNYAVVVNNIVSITTLTDLDELARVIEKFGMKYPTVEETVACVEYSTRLYWVNDIYLSKIRQIIEKLSPAERAAFVYIGDLYHIRKLNDTFVFDFLTSLKEKKIEQTQNPLEIIQKADEHILSFACQICSEEVKGLGKEYDKMPEITVQYLAGTVLNITKTLQYYQDFIQVFFASKAVPASVAYIPSMIRRAVVVSDTDSTMFSTDDYVQWYYKKIVFSPEALALASSVAFIATQSIANGLRILSANINVARNKLSILSMKPEYTFPVFVQTSVAKHYFASISVQEGNVYSKPSYEIKGVHLKSSAAPPAITKVSKEWMESILRRVENNEKISLKEKIAELKAIEIMIFDSIQSGKIDYFRSGKIKDLTAYAGALGITPYFHHLLWQEVFEPKYGTIEPIPYEVIKIPLNLPNKTACQRWITGITDKELAQRLADSLTKYNKDKLGVLLLNKGYCQSQGIPKEIIEIIDIRRIVLELTKSFRMIIESLGICLKKDMLIIDMET